MKRPIEIVILNDHASLTGGSAAVAHASARGLASLGHHVTLITCVGPVESSLLNVPNLEVICLGQPEIASDPRRIRAFAAGIRNDRAVRAVQSVLRKMPRGCTVVHVHSWTKALSPFAVSAACEMGFPVVVTLHDFFISCPNGGFYDYAKGELCPRVPLSASCIRCNCDRRNYAHKLYRAARTVIQNRMLSIPRRVAHFVGVSEFSLGVLRPHLPAAVPVTLVRNPLECADMGPADTARNRDFIFMGRFEAEKGVLLFAEAARSTGLPAVFVGDGALAPEAKRLCPDARFTGWLAPDKIRAELVRARALVFPPRWHETLGLVVIEAAAAGVPSIVADRCAATDIIRDGQNGLHFRHGDLRSLSEVMLRLAGDDALAARLGRAAYGTYWSDPWTVERHVGKLMEVYGGLTQAA